MSRSEILERAFLFTGLEVNGNQIYPLSANRRTFLHFMGNPFFGGERETANEEASMAEALFACTKVPAALGSYMNDYPRWRADVYEFAVTCEDYTLERFMSVMMDETESLNAGQVEPLGKDEAQLQAQA